MKKQFTAKLQTGGEGGAWAIIDIPFDVEKEFGSKGRVAVTGTVNGVAYRSSISPTGNGTHIMIVNRAMREATNLKFGDTTEVVMDVDQGPRTVEIPVDFKKALSKSKPAKVFFEQLPPSHKRAYIEAILEAKKPETRARRIEKAIEMLAAGKK